jgi:DNA-binding CsgD family transcriptional regulator
MVKGMSISDATPASVPAEPIAPAFAGPVSAAWSMIRAGRMRGAAEELHSLLRPTVEPTLTSAQLALALLLQVDLDLSSGEVGVATGHVVRLSNFRGDTERLAAALGRGEIAAAYGDHAAARDHFLAAGALPQPEQTLLRPWRVGAALALVRTGRRREGAELAREQVAVAEAHHDPFALAHALRALATAESARDPLGLLRRAQQQAALSGSQRLAVQLDTDVAALSVLSPVGPRPGPETVRILRRAEAYAGEEGLWPLHNRVIGLLVRLGEEPLPLPGRALDVLTPAEQRVARLAARGLTNREIAATLTVSVKGVEWHLSRVYRKLGISSRAALAPLLAAESSDAV